MSRLWASHRNAYEPDLRVITRVMKASGNLRTASVLSCILMYGRLQKTSLVEPPSSRRAGQRRSFRSWLVSTRLARHKTQLTMRDGSRIRCRILDGGALLGVHFGDYDIPGLDWAGARTIVDVGAHVGAFSVWAGRRSPEAQILAIEPSPETFALLSQNLVDNGLENRVIALNCAVGPARGSGALELVEQSLGTRLAPGGFGSVTVPIHKLDQVVADARIHDIDVLKIDCEGMEYEVFETMDPQQLRTIGAIACEYHPRPGRHVSSLDAILHSAGFTIRHPDSPLGILWATRRARVST